MITLNYKKFGETGEPLIVLHGLFGSLDNWKTLARKWSENFQVYIIDQRNHGKSPHTEEMNYEILADDLADFIQQNNIEQPNVLGHSMGGKTVLAFIKKYPNVFKKAIVADMSPKTYKAGHETIFKALHGLPLDEISSRKEADEWLQNLIPEVGIRQFLGKNLERKPERGFRWKFNLSALYNHYERILEGINQTIPCQKPVLFIRGGNSNYVDVTAEMIITEQFLNGRIQTIDNAGHWLHAEQPLLFFEAINTFLEK